MISFACAPKRSKTPPGVVIYKGPSMLDGAPIVGIDDKQWGVASSGCDPEADPIGIAGSPRRAPETLTCEVRL